jgi:hypothetical protein
VPRDRGADAGARAGDQGGLRCDLHPAFLPKVSDLPS